MFQRQHRSRVTVARGSALEMEIRRGRFRLSLLGEPEQNAARIVPPNLKAQRSRLHCGKTLKPFSKNPRTMVDHSGDSEVGSELDNNTKSFLTVKSRE
ncbi:Rhotekin-like [Crotalus adamanteus]|uniref:Rhotekin-like n=1 Tax=Crotalus adamanteus TaxID=8729 RepID=A0AAW1B8W5_CROAD